MSSSTLSDNKWIIFKYMSEGLCSLLGKSNPSARIGNPGQFANLSGKLSSEK